MASAYVAWKASFLRAPTAWYQHGEIIGRTLASDLITEDFFVREYHAPMRVILTFALAALLAANSSAQQSPAPAAPQNPGDPVQDKVKLAGDALQRNDFATTLTLSREVIASAPDNILALNLAGNAALRLYNFSDAIQYFRRALALQPDETHNVAGLMGAYSLAGMATEAAAEREHIRQLKTKNQLPSNFSFLADKFEVDGKDVLAVEFFPDPGGKYHYRYLFNVFNKEGKQVYRIALESDDMDQELFRKEHPEEAKSGGRAYTLDGYGPDSHATIKFYAGEPSYTTARDDSKRFLEGKLHAFSQTTRQTGPAPGSQQPAPQQPSNPNSH
jgi:tetratricopeptide (TPR) repeat protein